MPEELKEILRRELDELKQNKIRMGILTGCFLVLLIFWITDDGSDGEEIILDEPPLTKDLPVKTLPVAKDPDGVKIILGATADDRLFIGDPFAVEEKVEVEIEPTPEPTPPLPKIPAPSISIQPPPPST